jgi:hypothetical protein
MPSEEGPHIITASKGGGGGKVSENILWGSPPEETKEKCIDGATGIPAMAG